MRRLVAQATPALKQHPCGVHMRFASPLVEGRLIRRYKRFLADVELAGGEVVVAHVANPGAMTGLADPGLPVFLSRSPDPKRKLAHSLELVAVDQGRGPALVGVDTSRPNRIVEEALIARAIPSFEGYSQLRREVRYAEASRVDFVLAAPERPDCYVEVKNVHLVRRPGLAEFPDCVTARGARHLIDLAAVVRSGRRAVMLYFVHRADCEAMGLAADIDPAYARAFADARAAGVEAIAVGARVTRDAVEVAGSLPIRG